MVIEVADFQITPGAEEEFVEAYLGVRELLSGTPGCRSVRMTRSIESPSRFVLLVEWDSVEAHEQNFRASERFAPWRAAIGGFFAEPPHVEHVREI